MKGEGREVNTSKCWATSPKINGESFPPNVSFSYTSWLLNWRKVSIQHKLIRNQPNPETWTECTDCYIPLFLEAEMTDCISGRVRSHLVTETEHFNITYHLTSHTDENTGLSFVTINDPHFVTIWSWVYKDLFHFIISIITPKRFPTSNQ